MEHKINKIKKKQIKKEKKLSKYATKSKDFIRINDEIDNDLRTSYFRDIDRIIHSQTYTRYIDKTQVYIDNENDHITHRIIHVTLVSKIAKTIGRALNLNEDLIEAIAIGHDLGHPPYGHLGEMFLNEISKEEKLGLFSHNIQSVRALMVLENNGEGLNLCVQTLDGIMCHNGEMLSNIYSPKQKSVKDFLTEYNKSYNDEEVLKSLRPMTLEGCVVRVSDIIGYIGRDIEDAIELKRIKRENLPKEITKILGDNNKSIINTIILDIIKNSYKKPYIKMSEEIFKALFDLKKFNYENIYKKAHTKKQKEKYENKFNKLYYFYKKEMNNSEIDFNKKFLAGMNETYIKTNSINRKIIDYMAGFTDDFLNNQYKKYIQNINKNIVEKTIKM